MSAAIAATDRLKPLAGCLRLKSEAQETRLMASLGVGRFGNDVLVIVDLPKAA